MAEKQKNQIIVIEPITKTVNDLLEAILAKEMAVVSPFQNADEAIQLARQFEPCMLVLCIQNNNDIPPILNTLKKLKPDIKQGLIKTLLVSKIKNAQLQKLIGEFGVTDYIEEPIAARSLMFKANLQLKAVDTTRRQIEQRKLADEKIVFKSSKKTEEETQNLGSDFKARQKPALQLASDTFLIKNSPVKKQAKKFVVELDGPDPSTGEWIPEGEDPGNPAWRWKPVDKEEEPGSEEGDGWVSNGEKPHFKPAVKKWQISSEKPSLFFKKKDLKVAEKISVDEDGEITIAEDSPAAEENLRKNLKKAQKQKKKKQAEAAGIPFVEEEEEAKPAVPPVVAKAEEEPEKEKDPAVAARKKARLTKAAGLKPELAPEEAVEPVKAKTEVEEDTETAGRKKLEQLRKAREARKKTAVAAGLPVDPVEEATASQSKAEVEVPAEAEPESESVAAIQAKNKEKASGPKAESQLLNFLKKKKVAVEKPEEMEEPIAEAEPVETEAKEESPRLAALKKKILEKKAKADAKEPEETPEKTAPKLKFAPTPEEETEKEPLPELKFAEAAPKEEEHAELAALAEERRRKRSEKKKALLQEIQEESEPSAKEVEAIQRKRKAKAKGVEIAEDPEKEVARTERLESVKKKRAELDALDKESEEEEKNGISLHTHQSEEAKGINVWDSDEEQQADGPSEKRLKKLKKDRNEKAQSEAKESGETGDGEDILGSDKAAPSAKKKKKSGSSSQADGLKEIFSEEKEEESEELTAEKDTSDTEIIAEAEAPKGETRAERLERLRQQRDKAKVAATAEAESEMKSEAEEEEPSPKSESEDSEEKEEKPAAKEVASEEVLEKSAKKEFTESEALDLGDKKTAEKISAVSAEDLLKKKSENSESMKRFLERRKQKKEAEEAESASGKKPAEETSEAGQKRSFLGIFVAISDSFGVASERKLINIFRAFESALENCAVALTSPHVGNAPLKVLFAASFEKGAEIPVTECRIETFLDSQEQPVVNLALRMLAPRTDFAEDELEAIKRAVRALRPLVLQWLANAEKVKAA